MTFKLITLIAVSTTGLLVSACSPMNSEFSCNATAGDSCMTIEQVDAMTRYADGDGRRHANVRQHQRISMRAEQHTGSNNHGEKVWLAPRPMK
jgi:conjugal transfer pilus assembly protein TraV